MYKFLAVLLLSVTVATTFSKEKEVVVRTGQHQSGHNEKPANPPNVFYDDNGEITIISDSTNIGSSVVVKNEYGDVELDAVTYSSNSKFIISFSDESTFLKISITTPVGISYEGTIINN